MRIYCLEDNPLVVLHLEMMIEDAGHDCVGSAASFAEALPQWQDLEFDLALIDIDLADGVTGMDAARWLKERGRVGCFVTGQGDLARENADLVVDIVTKPIDETALLRAIDLAGAGPQPPGSA
ncbi:response regulator [Mangrovibrevibacter kandeliae]|uniref:response regulator n=1 Tax=Mangrovibrevibacter kandeliae TaxID=2968473 RepID=UPI00211772AC|nr:MULTISPECIES: response regulator [unclassified Aurantimonas]MCQ8784338.1 response regulator [Aurantimonas sp. CSK15Z-1]MCW4117123.1 response regulator [Aurantimonas sp. MSK8Z-1]